MNTNADLVKALDKRLHKCTVPRLRQEIVTRLTRDTAAENKSLKTIRQLSAQVEAQTQMVVSLIDQQTLASHPPTKSAYSQSHPCTQPPGNRSTQPQLRQPPYILNYTVTSNPTGNDDPNLTIQAPFLVSYLPLPQILIRVNALEEIIRRKESSGDAVATVVNLLRSAFGVEEEQAEAMVSFIQVPSQNHSTDK